MFKKILSYLPALVLVVGLACVANLVSFISVSAQADSASCTTVTATRATKYTVPLGHTAEPGNGQTYLAGARVWGPKIKVCAVSEDEVAGEGPVVGGSATTPSSSSSTSAASGWDVAWFAGATRQMRGEGSNPWSAFPTLNPPAWPEFPNVANPVMNFPASWGLEFGQEAWQHCGAADDECSIVVASGGYVLSTGNWDLRGLGKCHGVSMQQGCALFVVNVGDVSSEFEGMLDNVYMHGGRYWHGDHLPEATSAAMSNAVWNMVNGVSVLNPPGSVNAGANCSVRAGCQSVNAQFFIVSGNEVLIHGETTWSR